MLTDFERKLSQIIRNYLLTRRRMPTMTQLEKWTGHDADEIQRTISKLKHVPHGDGGLSGYAGLIGIRER